MSKRTGECKTCGADFIRVNKLRQYCTLCQAIRDTLYAPKKKRECLLCKTVFYPIKATYTICNDCREPAGRPDLYDECKGCGRNNRPAPGLEKFCMSCASRSEQSRLSWLRTALKIQAERVEQKIR